MLHRTWRWRGAAAAMVAGLALFAAACGDDGDEAERTGTATATSQEVDLSAIKTYLLDHTARLKADVAAIRTDAEAYHALAQGVSFDYGRLLADGAPGWRGWWGACRPDS